MSNSELMVPEQIAVWERTMERADYQRHEPDERLVSLVEPPSSRMMKALDIGCGWGRHLVWLAEQGWRVTGIDWAQASVKHARQALEKQKLNGQVIKGDYRKLPFANSEFNLIIATEVLNHGRLPDFKRALGEIKRVLRVNCPAIFNVPTVRNMPQSFCGIWVEETTVVLGSGSEAGLPHHFFTEEEIRQCTRQFRDVQIERTVEPLPPGAKPLHSEHVNEWLWVTLLG
jgi:ubiquinone/menaquinone biosynthesis C-methylase UbiE